MLYNWIVLPVFGLLLIVMASIKSQRMSNSNVLSYLSSISYAFFFGQFFMWHIFILFWGSFENCTNNLVRILFLFSFCLTFAVFLHEFIEKNTKKFLGRKLLK